MKEYILNNKRFVTLIIIELIFILFIVISYSGKVVNIELKADDFEIYDNKAEIRDYEQVDSLALDENTLLVYDNKETQDIEKSIYISETNVEEANDGWIIGSDFLTLRSGMYEVEVKYYSLWYSEYGGRSDEGTATVQIISANNGSRIFYNDLSLHDNVTVSQQRLWVRSLKSIDDVQIKVEYYGLGELRIDSITVRELPLWRLLKLFLWIFIFVMIDIIYILMFTDNNIKNKEIFLWLASLIIFSCLPIYTDFLFDGHDFDYHIARIWALAENIKAGRLSFPIQLEMLNGYGYASPIFYGQLFLYIPAIIYIMGAPMQVCFQIYIGLVNVATTLIGYYCFKGIVKDKKIASIGATLYTLSAYRIVNVYLRVAVGEYTAMVFLPLIIYGFAEIYGKPAEKISWKECLAVIIGFTGVIQSHVLTCEMLAIFIIVICVVGFKKTFELRRFISLGCTALSTVLLNAAFIVPLITSMGMNISVKLMETGAIQYAGTYLIQVLGVFMTYSGVCKAGMQDEMPLALGFSLVVGMGILILCNIKKYEWKVAGDTSLKVGTVCLGFAVCCIILTMKIFPWNSLGQISPIMAKILCTVQYPWRYLSIATIFATVATVVGLKVIKNHISHQSLILIEVVLMVFALIQTGYFYVNFSDSSSELQIYGGADVNPSISEGEYLIGYDTTATDIAKMKWKTIKADLANVGIANYKAESGTVSFICCNISDDEQLVQVPILNYDNYHVYIEDGIELEIVNGENNRLSFWVPAGYVGNIQVRYEIPLLWKIANIITAVVFIVLVLSSFILGMRSKKREICSDGL
jgi:hypothetical protein